MSSPSGQAQTPRNLQPRNNKLKTQNRRKQFSADRKQESGTGSKKQGGRDVLGDAPWRRGVWDSPAQLFPPTPSGRWPCAWPETAAEGSSGSATKKPQVQNSTGFSATKKLEPEARNKKGTIFLESCGRTLEAQAQRPGRARGAAVPSIGPRRPGVRRPVILVPGHLLLPLAVFHPALSDAASQLSLNDQAYGTAGQGLGASWKTVDWRVSARRNCCDEGGRRGYIYMAGRAEHRGCRCGLAVGAACYCDSGSEVNLPIWEVVLVDRMDLGPIVQVK